MLLCAMLCYVMLCDDAEARRADDQVRDRHQTLDRVVRRDVYSIAWHTMA